MSQKDLSILSTVKGGIQKVVFNRPEKMNAFSLPMYKELISLLKNSIKDERVLLFVLTGNGNSFTSGNDIGNILKADSVNAADDATSAFRELVDAFITYPKLLIAIVNGPAIGIGCTMLGLFDLVYASDKAYFHTPFTSLGLIAEGCSTYTFPRLFHSKAADMLYLGYKMSASEAKQYGFVSEVYKHDSLDKVWDYLNIVSKLSSESILAIKQLVSKWNKDTLLEVNAAEAKELRKRLESSDLFERFLAFLSRKNKL